LELKEIKQIVELMQKYELSYFHLEKDDFRLKLKKGADMDAMQDLYRAIPTAHGGHLTVGGPNLTPRPQEGDESGGGTEDSGDVFESPMVGTFYRSAKPDAEPFVKVGQEVEVDTTLCMIEAMKTFNEIKAEKRGTIVKILVDNAQPVQYGEPLFIIRPS